MSLEGGFAVSIDPSCHISDSLLLSLCDALVCSLYYMVCSVIQYNHRIEHNPTAATICREDLSGPLGVHTCIRHVRQATRGTRASIVPSGRGSLYGPYRTSVGPELFGWLHQSSLSVHLSLLKT